MPASRSERPEICPDGRMSVQAAAAYVGLSASTLAIHRCKGTGPRFVKRGRVWYFREDLDAWLNAAGRHTSTASARAMRPAVQANAM
jgi:hypothetical protein